MLARGAELSVYDPKAEEEAKELYLKDCEVEYVHSKYSALNQADALVLITEWAEFRSPDFPEMKQRMKKAVIFDGRNQYEKKNLIDYGFEYHMIGVKG